MFALFVEPFSVPPGTGRGEIGIVQRIFPESAKLDDDALVDSYAYPEIGGRPYVRANMVISLDGAAQGRDGRSGTLSSPADRRVFAMLRGLADVILVGAGTARAEKYGPAESGPDVAADRLRRGQLPAPPIAVVSGRLALDPEGPLLSGPGEPTIVVTHARSSPERRRALAAVADVLVFGEEKVDLAAALGELSVRGLTRVLCEGGPHLLAELVIGGLLDELCLTVSPIVRGGGALGALAGDLVSDGAMQLVHVLEEDGTLLTRWRPQRESSTSDRL